MNSISGIKKIVTAGLTASALLLASSNANAEPGRVISVDGYNNVFFEYFLVTYAPDSGGPNVTCSIGGSADAGGGTVANTALVAKDHHNQFSVVDLACTGNGMEISIFK